MNEILKFFEKYRKEVSVAKWNLNNVCDMGIFNNFEEDLMPNINTDILVLGLNISSENKNFCSNMHEAKTFQSKKMVEKLANALTGTFVENAILSDIIVNHKNVNSKDVMKKFKDDIWRNKKLTFFKNMLNEIVKINNNKKPVLIALGVSVTHILKKYFPDYKRIDLPHYSSYGKNEYSKIEKYVPRVKELLKEASLETMGKRKCFFCKKIKKCKIYDVEDTAPGVIFWTCVKCDNCISKEIDESVEKNSLDRKVGRKEWKKLKKLMS